ncbi:hypothetical protein [Microbacterium sp. NPDC090014]|uniref:hypothetical protein n=1 Tax=Microbacterium sp. NPDC090014 TaxID=3364205 RepID=UPI00382DA088
MLAALFGAVLGGLFTLRGQVKAAEAQVARDEIARQNQLADARRADAQDDARVLFRAFVDLERDVLSAPVGSSNGGSPWWSSVWQGIWTAERRSEFRVLAELIPEHEPREQIGEIVRFLSLVIEYSGEGDDPGDSNFPLRSLAHGLASEGLGAMSAYLRHDTYKYQRDSLWEALYRADAEMKETLNFDV